ncbi:pyrimidine-specific ribonucleoside hydrolase [Nocardia sp. GAS34]|uniref:nucleoside hydrolase n=1 Tax=unclassified Nocardia TaxID=2637762 RepID=UPI003D2029A0
MAIIFDTDIGGEPDDALALAVAAGRPDLSLVITSDEHDGRRAKMARSLLDLLMRSDVPVVAGRDLGRADNWAADGFAPEGVPAQPSDVLAAVDDLFGRTSEHVLWVGTGPMSNLADVLAGIPAAAQRLIVTQAAGSHSWLPDRAEPNIGADLPAARAVLSSGVLMKVLPVEVTSYPFNVIDRDSNEYDVLARSKYLACTKLRAHMDSWLEHHRSIDQSALLALASMLDKPFFSASPTRIGLNEIGQIEAGEYMVMMVDHVDVLDFKLWCIPLLSGVEDLPHTVVRPALPPIRFKTTQEAIEIHQSEPLPGRSGEGV